MKWEEMTTLKLGEYAKKEKAVAIVPIGSLETHGPHLPVGTDFLIGQKIASLAAEREEVVILPSLPYSWVTMQIGYSGAVNMKAEVLLAFWENIFDEVARNGFKKIILLNAHGGHGKILPVFMREFSLKDKGYTIYWHTYYTSKEVGNLIAKLGMLPMEHADEAETSIMLYLYPELCEIDKIPPTRVEKIKEFDVEPATVGFDWASDWGRMQHSTGDAYKATRENGEKIVNFCVDTFVELIKKIKVDDKVLARKKKYYRDARSMD